MSQTEREKILELDMLLQQAMAAMSALRNTAKSVDDVESLKYGENMEEVIQEVGTLVRQAGGESYSAKGIDFNAAEESSASKKPNKKLTAKQQRKKWNKVKAAKKEAKRNKRRKNKY